jgi:hypothetical protein
MTHRLRRTRRTTRRSSVTSGACPVNRLSVCTDNCCTHRKLREELVQEKLFEPVWPTQVLRLLEVLSLQVGVLS